jgi:hypothetical protein
MARARGHCGRRYWIAAALLALLLPAKASADAAACIRASDEGQRLRDDGSYAQAQASFVECAAPACPQMIRAACADWLAELQKNEPTLVFAARDAAGQDLANVGVSVDGLAVTKTIDGRPVAVDPGSHRVRFLAADGSVVETQIVVRAGEKNRVISATFAAPAPKPVVVREAPTPSRRWVLPVVTGSLAAGFLAADIVLVSTATSDLHGIESSSCAGTRSCNPNDVDSVQHRLDASKVFLVLSAVSVAVCVAALLWPSAAKAMPTGEF